MAKDKLRVIAPDINEHGEAVYDLAAKVFGGYYDMHRSCRAMGHEHYDWGASRIGLIGDQVVTHYGVMDYQMRIGSARVRTGGITGVATDGRFRRRGYMAHTARACTRAMQSRGYDMSVLFGLPDFYHRFGYVRAWSPTNYTVRLTDLGATPTKLRLRKITMRDLPEVDRLYNRWHARITGTAVRPTYQGRWRARERGGYLWCDGRGRPTGYVRCHQHDHRLHCSEAAGPVPSILSALATLARRRHCDEIGLDSLPHDSAVCRHVRRGTCKAETQYTRCGGALARTLSLRSTMQKLCAELSDRLRQSHMADWRGRLLIADASQTVSLTVNRSTLCLADATGTRHAIRGGRHLVQLILGTDETDEVIEAGRMRLTGDARRLAQILFCAQHPTLNWWDGY